MNRKTHSVKIYHQKGMWQMIKIMLSRKLGELRWTQAELARATGIRPNTINELYHDVAESVKLEHLDLICEALGCELEEILVRTPNKESILPNNRTGKLNDKEKP